jgi:hypothetical protein
MAIISGNVACGVTLLDLLRKIINVSAMENEAVLS